MISLAFGCSLTNAFGQLHVVWFQRPHRSISRTFHLLGSCQVLLCNSYKSRCSWFSMHLLILNHIHCKSLCTALVYYIRRPLFLYYGKLFLASLWLQSLCHWSLLTMITLVSYIKSVILVTTLAFLSTVFIMLYFIIL